MAGFTRQQIDTAYRKLKSYVYYDNFSLLLRQQIAHFESDEEFENRLDALTKFLSKQNIKGAYFQNLLMLFPQCLDAGFSQYYVESH